jgi:hypothetical protein
VTGSLFEPDGSTFVPTELARGPWDPGALHGGPPSALLARAIEAVPAPDDDRLVVARLTVELLRPIPLEPLAVVTELVRPGRKVQLVDAALTVAGSGVEVARARAVRIRTASVPLPHEDPVRGPLLVPAVPPGTPEEGQRGAPILDGDVAFHRDAIELRLVEGSWDVPGPVTVWGRLLVPVTPDEEPSPLQRTIALADMGNGVSAVLAFETHVFINPELSIHLWRLPVSRWIAMRSRTTVGPAGIGLAQSALYDEQSQIGHAEQSLFIDAL